MKVLALSNIFPSEQEPTRGTFNKQIFEALSEFCEVRVVSPRPWWTRLKQPGSLLRVPRQTIAGLDTRYPTLWGLPKGGVTLNGDLLYHSLRPMVGQLRRTFPFDAILVAWAYPDGYAAARLAQDFRCPVVLRLMGSDINDLAARPELRPKITWGLKQAGRVIAVSAALQEKVLGLGVDPERVRLQYNGVNGALFSIGDRQEARAQLGLSADRKLIVYVGNILPVKGTDVLVDSMKHLAHQRPDADLLIVGGGELEETVKASARELGDRVRFIPRQAHDKVPLWIRACDVFCLPSRNEGCPNVVLEALAAGRPVVATAVGGVPELIKAGCGVLVPSENPAALAEGLDRALSQTWDPQALRASVPFLSWREVGQTYYQLLTEACPSPPPIPQ